MKKLISLFLTLTTVFACLSMAIAPVAAAGADGAHPEVRFGGHQRTVVVGNTYGIRLIGLTNDLSADEVGFSVEVIRNDGKIATYEENITTVYTAITAYVEGEETKITAESLGAKYIFTLVLDEIDPTKGFWGYRVSTYYKIDTVKHFGDTHEIVYKGSEHYVKKITGKVLPVLESYSAGDWSDWWDADNYENVDRSDTNAYRYAARLWDGRTVNTGEHGGFRHTVNAYSQAKFTEPTVINRIVLTSSQSQDTNIGLKIEVSVDGVDWEPIHTVTTDDGVTKKADDDYWTADTTEIDIENPTEFNHIRVINPNAGKGFCLLEVEVYGTFEVAGEEMLLNLSNESKQTSSTGTSNKWQYSGSQTQTDRNSRGDYVGDVINPASLWDGSLGTSGNGCYGVNSAENAYSAVEFANKTVITKVQLALTLCNTDNKGAKIQASVDGTAWVDLHTLSPANGDTEKAFIDGGQSYWGCAPLTFTFDANVFAEYNHIRVFGNQYCLSEISVYGIKENYPVDFAKALNVGVVVETDPNKIVSLTFKSCGANGTEGTNYGYNGHDAASKQTTLMWDGKFDAYYSSMWTYGTSANTAYSIATMNPTAIDRIVVAASYRKNLNVGAKIQVSVDGENWVTLHTISNADGYFVDEQSSGLQYLEIDIASETAYSYIRVLGSKDGFYIYEVQVCKAA